MRRIVILVKTELMRLVFMVSRFLVGFIKRDHSALRFGRLYDFGAMSDRAWASIPLDLFWVMSTMARTNQEKRKHETPYLSFHCSSVLRCICSAGINLVRPKIGWDVKG